MTRNGLRLICAWAVALAIGGCAEEEHCVRDDCHTVRVRAPYTSIDVAVPTEDEEATHVDVDVDD